MRTIKFRAWEKKIKAMICPDYIDCDGDCFDFDKNTCSMKFDRSHDYILMQFTGLSDRDGKEIYESDIVRTGDGNLTVVWWDDRWVCVPPKNDFRVDLREASIYACEVIGNVWEHPSLLEDKNDYK